jgi:FkbM family methyltransferase
MDSKIIYHHIGARGGKFPISIPEKLRNNVELVMYDADETCINAALNNPLVKGFKSVKVLPYCVGSFNGKAPFYINKQPHTSSMLKNSREFSEFVRISTIYGAMRVGEIFDNHKAIEVNVFTLGSILEKENLNRPDFISLDIQGAEYDVIKNSKDIFLENIICVNLEIEFSSLYEKQNTFGELDVLLKDLGFILVDIKLYDHHQSFSVPLDLEGKGFPLDGEAVYFKKVDFSKQNLEFLIKYCFAALLHSQMHICIKIFEEICENHFDAFQKMCLLSDASPLHLIKELAEAYSKTSKVYLPYFHDTFTYKNYFNSSAPYVGHMISEDVINQKLSSLEEHKIAEILKEYGLTEFSELLEKNKRKNIGIYRKVINNVVVSSL